MTSLTASSASVNRRTFVTAAVVAPAAALVNGHAARRTTPQSAYYTAQAKLLAALYNLRSVADEFCDMEPVDYNAGNRDGWQAWEQMQANVIGSEFTISVLIAAIEGEAYPEVFALLRSFGYDRHGERITKSHAQERMARDEFYAPQYPESECR